MNYCKVCGKKLELTPEYDMCIECQGKLHRTYTLPNNDGVVSNKSSINRYDRYEDGIVIDKMSGENNLLDLVRVGDCVEIKSSVYLHRIYEQVYKGLDNQVLPYIYMNVHIETQYPLKNVNKEVITAIWFRSGDTMKRMEVEHERD